MKAALQALSGLLLTYLVVAVMWLALEWANPNLPEVFGQWVPGYGDSEAGTAGAKLLGFLLALNVALMLPATALVLVRRHLKRTER